MKCPLLKAGNNAQPDFEGREPEDCLKEECAWWHLGDESCSINDIATNLFLISLALIHINQKMPLARNQQE